MESLFVLDTHGTVTLTEKIDILYDAKEEAGESQSRQNKQKTGRNARRLSSVKRYHEIEKFSLYKPGKISSELRRALNLGKHDIPIHVYRMRSLGYPPGWLNKARVEDLPSFNEEKAEVPILKYKVDEIIEYPGFNVFSSKLRESCHVFGCPPIQRHHLIQNFIAALQQRTDNEGTQKTDWVGELTAKDLDSLEAERQRILAEINNLKAQSSSVRDASPVDLKETTPQSDARPISVSSGETNILSDPSSPDSVLSEERDGPDPVALSLKTPITSTEALPKIIPVEPDDQQPREEEQPAAEENGQLITEEKKREEAGEAEEEEKEEEGTTIPLSFQSSCSFPTGCQNSATEGGCEKKPRLEAFSAGIQPFMPFTNLPGTQGTYIRVRDSLKRARSCQGVDCQKVDDAPSVPPASVPSTTPAVQKTVPRLEPKKVNQSPMYSESRQTTVVGKGGWASEHVDRHRIFNEETSVSAAPPPQDASRWSYRKSSSEKRSWRLQGDAYAHSERHRDSRDDRGRDYHCSRGNYYQDEGYSGHYRDSQSDRNRGSHNDCNRNPFGHYSHHSRVDTGRALHRDGYNSHSRSPFSLPAPTRRQPEYSTHTPYHRHCSDFAFCLNRLRPEPLKRPNLQPTDETLARKRVREESSAIARRRAAAEITLTAEEITEFLARSDDDEDEKGNEEADSDASSDWDAIQEETVEQFLSVAASSSNTQKASISRSVTIAAGPSAEYRDVGVEKLFSVVTSQQLNEAASGKDDGVALTKTADDEAEDLLALTGACPDDLNEFGAKVQSSIAAAARERRARRVDRDVKHAIQVAEASPTLPARDLTPPASPNGCKDVQSNPSEPSVTTSVLTESQRVALKLREEKRKQTLAALGKSPASRIPAAQSATSGGSYFVATPTNIRVMRPLLSSELWATRTAGRNVLSLAQFLQEAARGAPKPLALQASEFVVVGVVGMKTPPRRSKNDKIYSIWRLTDMAGVGTGGAQSSLVSLFLFGSVHEKLWKEPEGTVVAILKPKIMSPSDMEDSDREVSITVDSAPFVMILGTSPDFGTCAGTTKSNKPCSRIINKSVCRYCDFHVKSAYYAASSIRPGFSTTNFPWTGHSNGRGGRGGGRGWKTGHAREISGSGGIFSLSRPATMPLSGTLDDHLHPGVSNSSFVRPKLSLAKLTSAGYSVSNGPNPAISSCAVPPVSGGGIAAQNALTPVEQTLASRLSRPSLGSRNLLRHLEKQNPVTSPGSQQVNSRSSKNRDPEPSPTPQLPAPAGTFANFFAGRSSARDDRRPSAKSPPVLGRGLQGVEAGSPNCLIDLGPVVSSSHTSTAPPARNAARMRAEAFVRARGGVARLEAEARKVAVGSRVSELVASSGSSQTTRPSPLSELLGNAPSNGGPTKSASRDSETSRSDADLQEGEKSRREAKRAELARLVSQGSQYTELVELEADLSDRSLLCRLEKRDEFEERLLSQHEQECQIVTCKTCNYRSLRADRECRKQGHILEFSTGTRRFFACRNCKARTTSLDRYPTLACKNCGESLFERAGAIAERKGPKLLSEKLLARGLEETFLS